jgi:hypothetical protein
MQSKRQLHDPNERKNKLFELNTELRMKHNNIEQTMMRNKHVFAFIKPSEPRRHGLEHEVTRLQDSHWSVTTLR